MTLTPSADPASILAQWTAPDSLNGDSIHGYRVYVDDGNGGPFNLAIDIASSTTYAFRIPSLECSLFYAVKVSAYNVAGEGVSITKSVWLGEPPSEPLNLRVSSILPSNSLKLEWDLPTTDGCLTILSYTLQKDDDEEYITDLSPADVSYTDDISTDGSYGTILTYRLKAENKNGFSEWSEPITITVGSEPNRPVDV